MNFEQIIGQQFLKNYFQKIIAKDRVPHTQLFVGKEGSGTLPMALAFAQELLCGQQENCKHKVQKLIHPDLNFIFPSVSTDSVRKPSSDLFSKEWREFLMQNPYANLFDWMKFLEVENKQGMIRVQDAENIIKKTAIKPYEAEYKVFIIWMIEKMNLETANKILKILEEPPADTKFILISEKKDLILPTILSRCQIQYFNSLTISDVKDALKNRFELSEDEAFKIAYQSNGNWNKALKLNPESLSKNLADNEFQKKFITWVHVAFSAKKDKKAIQKLIGWSEEMAGIGREAQKKFLLFAMETFRQAMLINYQTKDLAYLDFSKQGFEIKKLAPFVHGSNIPEIYEELNDAIFHIERNGNPKLIFLDLSIALTKMIHKAEKL